MSHKAEEWKSKIGLLFRQNQLLAADSNDRLDLGQAGGKEWEPDTMLDNPEAEMWWSAVEMQSGRVWSAAIFHEERKRNDQIRAKPHLSGYD